MDISEVARRSGLPAAACPARTHMECPTFRRLLRATLASNRRRGQAGNEQRRRGPGR